MSGREFRVMTFLYVTPPTEAEKVLHDLRHLCTLNDDVKALNPSISTTSIPGRLRIEFEFSAIDLEDAERIATASVEMLIRDPGPEHTRDSLMQGSNTLSFA